MRNHQLREKNPLINDVRGPRGTHRFTSTGNDNHNRKGGRPMISTETSYDFRVMTALALALALATASQAGPPPADKCEAAKNKVAGAYYSCLEKAEAKAISRATSPDYSKCSSKFDDQWDAAESAGAGACPDDILTAPMNAYLAAQASEVASVIAGASIPDCAADLATCEGDLAACETQPAGQVQETGQTICYQPVGSGTIACGGTGQDGELQKGVASSFTDNGDGTISDNLTGLVWEKLDDNGGIHDWNNTYSWASAFATKIATLNSTAFAGHDDWRLPNIKELETLKNFGAFAPSTFSAFSAACAPGCTVTTCSCTQSNNYWSSTSFHNDSSLVWNVSFAGGHTYALNKTGFFFVRAVRAGS